MILGGLKAGFYFVSRDGMRLAYSTDQSYSNLWLALSQNPNNGGQPSKAVQINPLTKGTQWLSAPSISPDDKWVAYA